MEEWIGRLAVKCYDACAFALPLHLPPISAKNAHLSRARNQTPGCAKAALPLQRTPSGEHQLSQCKLAWCERSLPLGRFEVLAVCAALLVSTWVWLKIKQEGLRRCWSMFFPLPCGPRCTSTQPSNSAHSAKPLRRRPGRQHRVCDSGHFVLRRQSPILT